MIGLVSLAYFLVFLLSPKDITDYTIVDTEYWGRTENRLMIKTAYEYNSKEDIAKFPKNLSDWNGRDFRYRDSVYKLLNADILLSRAYNKKGEIIWMDIINSKTGESFHKQKICVEGDGWTVDNENIAEFRIADSPNPFTTLYANRLDVSKKDVKQVMVYWFMFKKFGENDAVTMIRVSSPVVNSTEETFGVMKNFVEGQLFDVMYEKGNKESITVAEYMLKEYGNGGLLGMVMAIVIPLGFIVGGIRNK